MRWRKTARIEWRVICKLFQSCISQIKVVRKSYWSPAKLEQQSIEATIQAKNYLSVKERNRKVRNFVVDFVLLWMISWKYMEENGVLWNPLMGKNLGNRAEIYHTTLPPESIGRQWLWYVSLTSQNHLMQNTAYSGTDKIPFSKPKFRWEIRIEYAGLNSFI